MTYYFNISVLILIAILALNLYPLLLAGWTPGGKYALLGAIRSTAQTISYEIGMAFLLLRIIVVRSSEIVLRNMIHGMARASLGVSLPMVRVWLVTAFAESNRTPFDFSEGERELVSGFNVEYRSTCFAIIFMAEYGIILALRLVTSLLAVRGILDEVRMFGIVVVRFL